jgi:S1-C subfamily serine protease
MLHRVGPIKRFTNLRTFRDDIIVAMNDDPITSVHDLHKRLVGERTGVPCKLTVIRQTEQLTFYVTPAEMPPMR